MGYKKLIMIVDDNIIDQMITSKVLELNYTYGELMIMEKASDALNYLEHHKNNLALLPNLILLDLDMPSINGFGFLKKFSSFPISLKNACPIIVLTASVVEEDLSEMKNNPQVLKLVSKPLTKDSLASIY